eukprot:365794-Chlamydomonas_euryale.AAC.3
MQVLRRGGRVWPEHTPHLGQQQALRQPADVDAVRGQAHEAAALRAGCVDGKSVIISEAFSSVGLRLLSWCKKSSYLQRCDANVHVPQSICHWQQQRPWQPRCRERRRAGRQQRRRLVLVLEGMRGANGQCGHAVWARSVGWQCGQVAWAGGVGRQSGQAVWAGCLSRCVYTVQIAQAQHNTSPGAYWCHAPAMPTNNTPGIPNVPGGEARHLPCRGTVYQA